MGMMQHPDTASTGQRAGPAFVKNAARPYHNELLAAALFDVDGVLLASPHERAWREALLGLTDPARFTTALY